MVAMPGLEDATRSGLLLRLTRQITARHDLDDVLGAVFQSLRPLVAFGGGSIQLIDEDGWIRMAASEPAAPSHVMAQRLPLGSSIGGRVILTESPIYLRDIEAKSAVSPGRVSSGVRSYLGVPLVADGRAIGLLQVDSPQPDAWTAQDRALFVAVAPVVAAAIQNARAYAREAAIRRRVEQLESRLDDVRRLAAVAGLNAERGDLAEVERQLAQIEDAASDRPARPAVHLPLPRELGHVNVAIAG